MKSCPSSAAHVLSNTTPVQVIQCSDVMGMGQAIHQLQSVTPWRSSLSSSDSIGSHIRQKLTKTAWVCAETFLERRVKAFLSKSEEVIGIKALHVFCQFSATQALPQRNGRFSLHSLSQAVNTG